MKRFIIILVLLAFAFSGYSQVKQEVIASAGGYNVNGGLSISWTLGETIIPTFTSQDGSLALMHGFQQRLVITAIEENLDVITKIKVFPNPASEVLNIQFEEPVDGEIVLSILDSQGKLIKSDIIESTIIEKQINMQDLATGIYYIRMTQGKLINVYKVIKL
jgi:hypothetical protein